MKLFNFFKKTFTLVILLSIFFVQTSFAINEEANEGYVNTYKGKVLGIISENKHEVAESGTWQTIQKIKVEILDKDKKGKIIEFDNDRVKFKNGDKFYFDYYKYSDGEEYYAVLHRDIIGSIFFLIGIFVIVVIAFGGKQGVRSLISLVGSLFVIFYLLVPGLLGGFNPIFVSFVIASGILFMTIYLTHGFNRESNVAFVGTMISVLLAGVFAIFAVYITRLSGFESEEAVFLNLKTGGSLDFVGLLLGSIIIGVLGVLDDISVTQAAFVTELYSANKSITSKEVYKRASRVGREHVGALVNTLALAYTGAFLPIILYFKMSPPAKAPVLNLEIFATELVRIIVSSVALILTVPIVTIIAVKYLRGYKSKNAKKVHVH